MDLNAALVRWFGEFAENGIFTTDDRLIVTSWNRWLERHSGRPAAEVVGQPLLAAWPDLEARGLAEYYREALAGRAHLVSHLLHSHLLPMPATQAEHLFGTMPQRARIAPLVTGDERIIGTITVIDEVSERVASEHELRKQIEAQQAARATAEAALRVKDSFLAMLSHEIRTPLNAVMGWAKILRDNPGDEATVLRGASVIDRNASLQLRMMEDLLDTARVTAGKLRLRKESVDLAAVAVAALEVVAPAAEAKGIEMKRTLPKQTARVLGDADRLQQVLWNLLSNAVKFTPRGGRIELRVEHADRQVRTTVTDTGDGITPEFLPFVFDHFAQAESEGRRESGLGLGLALVRELVTLHGGTVSAQSEGQGRGATFVIHLPALAEKTTESSVVRTSSRQS